MVRAPCCEKMGLKKGPWTPDEDQILISYVQKHGHANWRALPKQAGLLRCGKSCRLRWINYLRPDIKRGNFTYEEEETIIKLHEMWGNRWSAIAARLPGRTDNEIKNVWHTHLKKRLNEQNQVNQNKGQNSSCSRNQSNLDARRNNTSRMIQREAGVKGQTDHSSSTCCNSDSKSVYGPGFVTSLERSRSDVSSITEATTASTEGTGNKDIDSTENLPEIDESFWSDGLSSDGYSVAVPLSFGHQSEVAFESSGFGCGENFKDEIDYWYDIFIRTGGQDLELGKI